MSNTPENNPTRSALPGRLALLLGIIVLGGYLAHAWLYFQQIDDEAFVTFRYAQNVANGDGPYFNPGERVEGFNNFLFLVQMSLATLLFGASEAPFVAKLLGLDGGLGAVLGAWLLAGLWLRTVEPLREWAFALGWIAGGLVAVNAAFAMHSTTGLGTVQYSALLIIGLVLLQLGWQRERWQGAGILFALALLSRPEAVLILLGIWVARWYVGELTFGGRSFWLDTMIVGGTLVGYAIFRALMFDGQLVPNTFYAKLGGLSQKPEISYLAAFMREHLGGMFVAFGVLPLLAGSSQQCRNVWPTAGALASVVVAVLLSGSDPEVGYRFLVPYTPLWAACAAFGIALAGMRIKRAPRLATLSIGVLLAATVWLTQLPASARYSAYVTARSIGFEVGHRALASWLQKRADAGDTVALLDPGVVGFNCPDLRILDLSGMNHAAIARAPGGFLGKQLDPDTLLGERPAFVVIVNQAPHTELDNALQIDPGKIRQRSRLEYDLIRSATFAKHYDRPRAPRQSDDRLEPLAALLGAERIFMHKYPGMFYMLTVYPFDPEGVEGGSEGAREPGS